jgi:hypothetical protein
MSRKTLSPSIFSESSDDDDNYIEDVQESSNQKKLNKGACIGIFNHIKSFNQNSSGYNHSYQ